MTPERLRQIEALYHAVREADADQRAALLDQADAELRREVEQLLSQHTGDGFLDRPAMQRAAGLFEDSTTVQWDSGVRLGPYQLEHRLGEGGMGEVFRAVDTRLGRAVAVKITREQFTARFEREARAIASLNHPNVCTVHDVGPNYLVMELVEGETLAARLKRGPLSQKEALLYASQIAAALAAAHAKGIIHRDLKPANVMVTSAGVKVLDFGLATLEGATALTVERMVMGTPAYMAPEQRAGEPADARTDIYAFGCVLYEMLTGTRAALQRSPLPSRPLERIVSRCLEEDPRRRWQSAGELQGALAAIPPARRVATAAVAAAVILALCAAGAYVYWHRTPTLTDTDTIVLADFTNTTGDPVFDDMLRQGLAAQLEESPFLKLISDAGIRRTLEFMNEPPDARLTPDIAQEVCARTGSAAILEGSIATLGSQYVLGLRATDCHTGDTLATAQAEAARKEDVLRALSQIAISFRTRVGESLASVQKFSGPREDATTTSFEAWKAYSTGVKGFLSGDPAAQQLFKRAVVLDPEFASAHAMLGISYSVMGESTLSRAHTLEAYQLRHRVSDRERLGIETFYDRDVTGNLQREEQTLLSWAQMYPRDAWPPGLLSGLATTSTGRHEHALEAADQATALDPANPAPYASRARNFLYLGRLDEAEATIRWAAENKLSKGLDFLVVPYLIAVARDDSEGMARAAAAARGQPAVDAMLSHLQALALARAGRLEEARRTARAALDHAQESGQRERAATFEAAVAVWEAFYGHDAAARQTAANALDRARGRDLDYAAAFALALAGDVSRARAVAEELSQTFPEDTSVQSMYLPTLRALFDLNGSQPDSAIQQLEAASRFDLALGALGFNSYFGALYPVYVRGLAYLAARQPEQAAAEFQKIVDHRSIVLADPVDAMARLQLARSLVLTGDIDKARRAYGDLLTLWKDADRNVPTIDAARAEYERLR
jgi:eukaryotic-like serine/threonine-protein kinase